MSLTQRRKDAKGTWKWLCGLLCVCAGLPAGAAIWPQEFTTNTSAAARDVVTNIASGVVGAATFNISVVVSPGFIVTNGDNRAITLSNTLTVTGGLVGDLTGTASAATTALMADAVAAGVSNAWRSYAESLTNGFIAAADAATIANDRTNTLHAGALAGYVPIATLATNAGSDGQVLSKTGLDRAWVDDQTGGAGSQTPWTGDINGAGYSVTNVSSVAATNHLYIQRRIIPGEIATGEIFHRDDLWQLELHSGGGAATRNPATGISTNRVRITEYGDLLADGTLYGNGIESTNNIVAHGDIQADGEIIGSVASLTDVTNVANIQGQLGGLTISFPDADGNNAGSVTIQAGSEISSTESGSYTPGDITLSPGSLPNTTPVTWGMVSICPSGGKFSIWGADPVDRQPGGNLTAGDSYGSNERDMLNKVYTALRNLGFIEQ